MGSYGASQIQAVAWSGKKQGEPAETMTPNGGGWKKSETLRKVSQKEISGVKGS